MSKSAINATITTVAEMNGYLASQFEAAAVRAARVALPGPQTVTTIEDFVTGAEKVLEDVAAGASETSRIDLSLWTQAEAAGIYIEVTMGELGRGLVWIPEREAAVRAIRTLVEQTLGRTWTIEQTVPDQRREHWGSDQYAGGLAHAGDITASRAA